MSNLDSTECLDLAYAKERFGDHGKFITMHAEKKQVTPRTKHTDSDTADYLYVQWIGTIRFRFPNNRGAAFIYKRNEEWTFSGDMPTKTEPLKYSLHSMKYVNDEPMYDGVIKYPTEKLKGETYFHEVRDSKEYFSAILALLNEIRENPCLNCRAYWFVKIIGFAREAQAAV